MTKEDAIKMLKSKMDGNVDTSYEWCECIRISINALEQEPCTDAVSRQYLVGKIEELFEMGDCYCDKYSIIGTINQAPPVNPNVCIDAVSRQEAIDAMSKSLKRVFVEHRQIAEKCISDLPPVTPTRPKGRWIGYVRSNGTVYHCEKCGRKTVVKENFCPHCGADMREGEE